MQFSHHVQQKQFDEDIILATSLGFLIAGYDTTGIILYYTVCFFYKNFLEGNFTPLIVIIF